MAGKTFIASFAAILLFERTAVAPSFQDRSVRLDVELVLVNVTVTDSANRPVMGLQAGDFKLWENKVEQEVKYFSSEQAPLSAGIILDLSSSMKHREVIIRDAISAFLDFASREDEYFLIKFSDRPELANDFTRDVDQLRNTLLFSPIVGNTALFDAVYVGMEKLKEAENSKRAILLITDGEDNHSRYSLADVIERVREMDIQIYVIGLVSPISRTARPVLNNLAEVTGGQAFFPWGASEIKEASLEIANQLKNEYILGYVSTDKRRDGRWRNIRVKVDRPTDSSRFSVRSKQGYYAPSTVQGPPKTN